MRCYEQYSQSVSAGHCQQAHPVRQFVRQSVLIVISTGKVGIETPHRNHLVMEGPTTHVFTTWVGRTILVPRYYTCALHRLVWTGNHISCLWVNPMGH